MVTDANGETVWFGEQRKVRSGGNTQCILTSTPLSSQNHPETHCKHRIIGVDTPFLPKGILMAHSGRASLFPPGMVLRFSEPQSTQMRPHVAFDHIASVPWKVALRWYRIKSTEIWFVFPPVIIRSPASESVQLYSPGNSSAILPRKPSFTLS